MKYILVLNILFLTSCTSLYSMHLPKDVTLEMAIDAFIEISKIRYTNAIILANNIFKDKTGLSDEDVKPKYKTKVSHQCIEDALGVFYNGHDRMRFYVEAFEGVDFAITEDKLIKLKIKNTDLAHFKQLQQGKLAARKAVFNCLVEKNA